MIRTKGIVLRFSSIVATAIAVALTSLSPPTFATDVSPMATVAYSHDFTGLSRAFSSNAFGGEFTAQATLPLPDQEGPTTVAWGFHKPTGSCTGNVQVTADMYVAGTNDEVMH